MQHAVKYNVNKQYYVINLYFERGMINLYKFTNFTRKVFNYSIKGNNKDI